jgi:hypothetical protein
MVSDEEYREDYYRMRNYQNTQPEDNPLTDDYEARVEEYHERVGNLQNEHMRRKEEDLELQDQWKAEQAMSAKEAMKLQEEMFNDPEFIEIMERS